MSSVTALCRMCRQVSDIIWVTDRFSNLQLINSGLNQWMNYKFTHFQSGTKRTSQLSCCCTGFNCSHLCVLSSLYRWRKSLHFCIYSTNFCTTEAVQSGVRVYQLHYYETGVRLLQREGKKGKNRHKKLIAVRGFYSMWKIFPTVIF